MQDDLTSISANRYAEVLRAAKYRDKAGLIAFLRLAEGNPSRAGNLGYRKHLLQLARIWGDGPFADAISVLPEESRISVGNVLLSEVQDEFTDAFPRTLSSYQLSRTMSHIPRRLP
jgi:hypothetical protein